MEDRHDGLCKNTAKLVLGLVLTLCTTFLPTSFAQSWKVTRGYSVGALLPSETRKLSDGSTYLTRGARYLVDTEDPT